MALKEKTSSAAVAPSPRKTRSMTSGKRAAPPAAEPTPKRQAKKSKPAAAEAKPKKAPAPAPAANPAAVKVADKASDASSKTIIVEACKQCRQFKMRAEMVKSRIESAATGVVVEINPEKPRRGCFEIRESNGEVFVSLLNMPRPFTPMRNLDMDKLITKIIGKIN